MRLNTQGWVGHNKIPHEASQNREKICDSGSLSATAQLKPHQTCRSTIIFLISAMALAGFNPLGQVLVQFMIVWQR